MDRPRLTIAIGDCVLVDAEAIGHGRRGIHKEAEVVDVVAHTSVRIRITPDYARDKTFEYWVTPEIIVGTLSTSAERAVTMGPVVATMHPPEDRVILLSLADAHEMRFLAWRINRLLDGAAEYSKEKDSGPGSGQNTAEVGGKSDTTYPQLSARGLDERA